MATAAFFFRPVRACDLGQQFVVDRDIAICFPPLARNDWLDRLRSSACLPDPVSGYIFFFHATLHGGVSLRLALVALMTRVPFFLLLARGSSDSLDTNIPFFHSPGARKQLVCSPPVLQLFPLFLVVT
jgi:hypothetical protein